MEGPPPRPGPGQLLSRTIYLSLDPYMRGRMNRSVGYAPTVDVGGVMVGGTVGQVVESNLAGYQPGDFILCANGWQEYGLSDGTGVRKLDPADAPISTAVGVLGMPGHTAYVGLLDIGRPQPGETVVVSAASGAVGAVVGQIARIKGCRVVGVAGAQEKCDYVTRELGFDACISRFDEALPRALRAACPDGIDVYFENVGGAVFDAVLPLLNTFARVPICGRIANYNQSEAPPGPNLVPRVMGLTLVRRLTIRGFIVFDHANREAGLPARRGRLDQQRRAALQAKTSSRAWSRRCRRSRACCRARTSASCWCRCRTTPRAEPWRQAHRGPAAGACRTRWCCCCC